MWWRSFVILSWFSILHPKIIAIMNFIRFLAFPHISPRIPCWHRIFFHFVQLNSVGHVISPQKSQILHSWTIPCLLYPQGLGYHKEYHWSSRELQHWMISIDLPHLSGSETHFFGTACWHLGEAWARSLGFQPRVPKSHTQWQTCRDVCGEHPGRQALTESGDFSAVLVGDRKQPSLGEW